MPSRIKDFLTVTGRQQRGIAVLTVVLLVLCVLAALRGCGGERVPVEVEVIPLDSLAAGVEREGRTKGDTLFVFDPSEADSVTFVRLGFSPGQARTILNFRANVGGRFRSAEQFAKSYAVSDSMFRRLEPYIKMRDDRPAKQPDFTAVDVNRASLARLRAHSALDDELAGKLFRARVRYGGFVDAAQLRSVLPSDSVEIKRFLPYAVFDTAALVRYDVNLDSESLLAEHPYISRPFAREILKHRSERGDILCFDSLRRVKYFPKSKAGYLRFYLNFEASKNEG